MQVHIENTQKDLIWYQLDDMAMYISKDDNIEGDPRGDADDHWGRQIRSRVGCVQQMIVVDFPVRNPIVLSTLPAAMVLL